MSLAWGPGTSRPPALAQGTHHSQAPCTHKKPPWEPAGPRAALPGEDVRPAPPLGTTHSGERTAEEAEDSPSRTPHPCCLPPRPPGWIKVESSGGKKVKGWMGSCRRADPHEAARGPCQPSAAPRAPAARRRYHPFGIAELSFALFWREVSLQGLSRWQHDARVPQEAGAGVDLVAMLGGRCTQRGAGRGAGA